MKPLISDFKFFGQQVTSEVRSMSPKPRNCASLEKAAPLSSQSRNPTARISASSAFYWQKGRISKHIWIEPFFPRSYLISPSGGDNNNRDNHQTTGLRRPASRADERICPSVPPRPGTGTISPASCDPYRCRFTAQHRLASFLGRKPSPTWSRQCSPHYSMCMDKCTCRRPAYIIYSCLMAAACFQKRTLICCCVVHTCQSSRLLPELNPGTILWRYVGITRHRHNTWAVL